MSDPSSPETPTASAIGLASTSEVKARTGVPATILRPWVRRCGIPRLERTRSSHRLDSLRNLSFLEFMLAQMASGAAVRTPLPDERLAALLTPDHPREVLAQTHAERPVEQVFTVLVGPTLCEPGGLWERGKITVTHGHQAVAVPRTRPRPAGHAAGQGARRPLVVGRPWPERAPRNRPPDALGGTAPPGPAGA